MFTLFAAPVVLLEGVGILLLVGFALARIRRIDRPSGRTRLSWGWRCGTLGGMCRQ